MPKTNQIAAKAYRTSLDSKIEDLKPGSACPAPTKNEKKIRKFDLDRRQKVKGQHKGQKKFCIFIPQDIKQIFKKALKASELFKFEGFSKCGCGCGCGCGRGVNTKTNIAAL